jgi:hypothetical protein
MKWVFIILGLLFLSGGCCTCAAIATAAAAGDSASTVGP